MIELQVHHMANLCNVKQPFVSLHRTQLLQTVKHTAFQRLDEELYTVQQQSMAQRHTDAQKMLNWANYTARIAGRLDSQTELVVNTHSGQQAEQKQEELWQA